jgi:hypothetical protein
MIGGPPIFAPGMHPGMMPGNTYGMAPQAMPQQMPAQSITPQMQPGAYVPPRLQPPQPRAQQPTQARMPVADVRPAPRLARGVRPSDPEPRSGDAIAIPSPEELGVTPAGQAASLDWNTTRRQMQDLGVTRFQMEHLNGGGARLTCWLTGGSSQMIQGDGTSEAEAVRSCLDRLRGLRR